MQLRVARGKVTIRHKNRHEKSFFELMTWLEENGKMCAGGVPPRKMTGRPRVDITPFCIRMNQKRGPKFIRVLGSVY